MRRAPMLLLLVPLAAQADTPKPPLKPKTLTLSPAEQTEHEPVQVTKEDADLCALSNDGQGLPHHVQANTKAGDAEVVFDCGAIPAGAELFIHKAKQWYSTSVGVIVDVETMSNDRSKLTLDHADFTTGGIGHGKTGVLLQLDLRTTALDATDGAMPVKTKRLVACTFEDQPRCGRIDITGKGVGETALLTSKGIKLAGDIYQLE